MFSLTEIQKLLSEIIPSAPASGTFPVYEMTGEPFFDKANDTVITPVLQFEPFYVDREGDEVLRSIYFILKKNYSASAMMLIFSGTNEKLSRITTEEFIQRLDGITQSMLESFTKVI